MKEISGKFDNIKEVRWPNQSVVKKYIKEVMPDLKPGEEYELGIRLLKTEGKLKKFIQEIEKSSDIKPEDMDITYTCAYFAA